MERKLIVDENIPNSVIVNIRKNIIINKLVSIRDIEKGMQDEDIIKLSNDRKLPILTMDKDFGFASNIIILRRLDSDCY